MTPLHQGGEELVAVRGDEPAPPRFVGRSHDEVLAADLGDGPLCLVADMVEASTLGVLAGAPETYKSITAANIAVGVARGSGSILGRDVLVQGNVGYFWQDDSTRNEISRIKKLAQAARNDPGLPLRWFLNEGLMLPADLAGLRRAIVDNEMVLAVLDSFYNMLPPEIGMKEEEAARVLIQLKPICDETGCTIAVVDHASWPSDANGGRGRAYGSVFKQAAVRWGVYFSPHGDGIRVEIRGNNIRGLRPSPARFVEASYEVRLDGAE
jgi:hypothetical protein